MPRPRIRVCSTPGCPDLHSLGGKCPACRRTADQARGTPAQRGYDHEHRTRFRPGVLAKHPTCQWPEGCIEPSTVADHWPLSRRDLVAQGLDANDPDAGRGLCHVHHGKATAAEPAQRGGWNDREQYA
ncbi:5-methylcytosine-specific restriction protein A [Pseudonocardia sediminis]|uniref:5-methylcytosine-specific restriction protein A n=1 Tax=Pseudonocardia sediminis TaxID=1397368 RepID=A0A4Q7V1X1_PSEST|nr:5-methylcytosine-specific restriction protein A [Pseudonocardia sediminis]